jgi:hypothetical protein
MKLIFSFLFISTLVVKGAYAQSAKTYVLDLKDPKSVVNAMFYAAQTKDFEILQCLCDPFGENDGDTRNLCSMSSLLAQTSQYGGNAATEQAINQFVQMFQLGRLSGSITFEEIEGVKYANVPFLFNHPGGENRSNESMQLVNRYGNWYFSSF